MKQWHLSWTYRKEDHSEKQINIWRNIFLQNYTPYPCLTFLSFIQITIKYCLAYPWDKDIPDTSEVTYEDDVVRSTSGENNWDKTMRALNNKLHTEYPFSYNSQCRKYRFMALFKNYNSLYMGDEPGNVKGLNHLFCLCHNCSLYSHVFGDSL